MLDTVETAADPQEERDDVQEREFSDEAIVVQEPGASDEVKVEAAVKQEEPAQQADLPAEESLDQELVEEEVVSPPEDDLVMDGSLFEREMRTALVAIKDLQVKLELSFNMQDALQADLTQAHADLKVLQREKLGFDTKYNHLKEDVEAKQLVIERVQDELSFLEEEKMDGDEKIRTLQDKLKNREAELKTFINETESLRLDKQDNLNRVMDLKTELGMLKTELSDTESELSAEKVAKEEALRRVRELETELTNLRSSREALLEIRKALVDTNNKVRDHFYQSGSGTTQTREKK